MSIQITSDNLEVSASMKALAEQKLSRLQKQISKETPEDLVDVRVVLNKADAEGQFEAKVEFVLGGMKFFGRAEEFSMESAIVEALNDTIRQFRKEREKRNDADWEERRKLKVYQDSD